MRGRALRTGTAAHTMAAVPKPVVIAACCAVFCASASCAKSQAPATARHFVLVTIDTLRADRVGVYGGGDLTPTLDRLAREGAHPANAMTHVPLTRPSHATLLSGLLPWEHGLRDNLSPADLPASPLLAEIVKGAGFRTAAFVSSVVLERRGGFARGFDRYGDDFPRTQAAIQPETLQKPGTESLRAAIQWLESQRGADRLFLWLHLYEPHDPYEPPEPYASRYRDRPYDGEVAYVDSLVGQLDEALERLGLKAQTLLTVLSDHGEGLGEHEETLHGFFVYQTTLAIPVIVRGPGVVPGKRIAANFGLVDVLPTALDLLEVPRPGNLQTSGLSFAAAFRGGPEPTADSPQYAESLVPLLHFGWSDLRVLRRGSWKYVLAPRPELYDLASDPRELRNLVAEQKERADAFRATLAKMLEYERRIGTKTANRAVPVDVLERLGALGYVSGDPASTKAAGADPKDKIMEFRRANELMREGIQALNRRDHAPAAAAFESLIGSGIESSEAHLYLARAYVGLNRPDRAAPHFEEAARRTPLLAEAWVGLADMRLRLRSPNEAVKAFQAALPLLPKDAVTRQRLGELQRDLGQIDAALATLRDAVAVDPTNASAWNALGMTLGGNGRLDEAEDAFRTAIARDATDHRYYFNLGLALARRGRSADARPYFEKTLELAPDFAAARVELQKLSANRAGR